MIVTFQKMKRGKIELNSTSRVQLFKQDVVNVFFEQIEGCG